MRQNHLCRTLRLSGATRTASSLCGLLALYLFAMLLPGCGTTSGKVDEQLLASIKSILVMPVQATTEKNSDSGKLEEGVMVMNRALISYFDNSDKVKILTKTDEQMQEMPGGNRLTLLRDIAHKHNSNAVLVCNLNRYVDRQGKKYAIESPASVAFDCKLIEVENGRALCFFDFKETQQALSENLLTLPDARRRGFKWLTAEELLKDGLNKKLSACPYLAR